MCEKMTGDEKPETPEEYEARMETWDRRMTELKMAVDKFEWERPCFTCRGTKGAHIYPCPSY